MEEGRTGYWGGRRTMNSQPLQRKWYRTAKQNKEIDYLEKVQFIRKAFGEENINLKEHQQWFLWVLCVGLCFIINSFSKINWELWAYLFYNGIIFITAGHYLYQPKQISDSWPRGKKVNDVRIGTGWEHWEQMSAGAGTREGIQNHNRCSQPDARPWNSLPVTHTLTSKQLPLAETFLTFLFLLR